MANERNFNEYDAAAVAGASGLTASKLGNAASKSARIASAQAAARVEFEAAERAVIAHTQAAVSGPVNPQTLTDLVAKRTESARRLVKLEGMGGTLTSKIGQVAGTDLTAGLGGRLGAKITPKFLGNAAKSSSKFVRGGVAVAKGGVAIGASYGLNGLLEDSEDERGQKMYNELKYGHYETNDEIRKRTSLTETGNVGADGISEEEVRAYLKANTNAFGREYGGHGDLVRHGSNLIASIYNPIAGILGGGGQAAMVNGAEDKFNRAMVGSLASQAQGRRNRNAADDKYGDQFSEGLLGPRLGLENMQGVEGLSGGPKIIPYADQAAKLAKKKLRASYDAEAEKDLDAAVQRPNAARDGGQSWFQGVQQRIAESGMSEEDAQDFRQAAMMQQGIYRPTLDDAPADYKPPASAAPSAATPASVIRNGESTMSDVRSPINQSIKTGPITNPQDAENLFRTRSIMSGETNVDGAIGQSQTAYMNNRGMLSSAQQTQKMSDFRQQQWADKGIKGFGPISQPSPNQYAARTPQTGLPNGVDSGDDFALRMFQSGEITYDQLPSSITDSRAALIESERGNMGSMLPSSGTMSTLDGVVNNASSPMSKVSNPSNIDPETDGYVDDDGVWHEGTNPAYHEGTSGVPYSAPSAGAGAKPRWTLESLVTNNPFGGPSVSPTSRIPRPAPSGNQITSGTYPSQKNVVTNPSNMNPQTTGYVGNNGVWHEGTNPPYREGHPYTPDSASIFGNQPSPQNKPKKNLFNRFGL